VKTGRRGLQQLAAQPLREVHALTLDIRAGLLPKRQRFLVVAKLDADLLQHRVGIGARSVESASSSSTS
jgi:hypothetical protein